jgi:hypothetical protein
VVFINKPILITLLLIVVMFLSLFSPWLTPSTVESIVINEMKNSQRNITDGCGINCNGCGIKNYKEASFGRYVDVEFACGMLPKYDPKYHKMTTFFVSFLGTVHQVDSSSIPNL